MSWLSDLTDLLSGGSGGSTGGGIDWTRALISLGGGYALSQSGAGSASAPPTGYQGGIPRYTAVRQAANVPYDPNVRPGSAGQRYFSTQQFVPAGGDLAAANTAASEEAAGLASLAQLNPARQMRAAPIQRAPQGDVSPIVSRAPARVIEQMPVPQYAEGLEGYRPRYAAGGIAHLAGGGRYLAGATDGMEDKVPANIDGRQPAALSDGEFVIPADVVSHLGNGNSTAGAKQLEQMMTDVRKARTGNPQQGRQIDARNFIPR